MGDGPDAVAAFRQQGLQIVAAFDQDARRVGRRLSGVMVYAAADIADIVGRLSVKLGIFIVLQEAV